MSTLVIYDTEGTIFDKRTGEGLKEPVGIPFLWLEVPEGKYLESINVYATPHEPVFVDLPPSETDKIRLEMAESNAEMFELIFGMNGGL